MTLAYPDTVEAKVLQLKEPDKSNALFLNPDNIFSFRVGPVNVSRWTRIDIPINLPREPLVAFTQVRFPGNAQLNVSDNFSCTTAILSRTRLQVNVWRTDNSADPAINYDLDCLIITR